MLTTTEALTTPLLAFGVTAAAMPLVNRLARKTGFVDHPNARKIHTHPIPVLGGVGVYLGVMSTLLLCHMMDYRVALMMAASFLVMLLGVVDDRLDVHSRFRLLLHVMVAGGLAAFGVRFHFFPSEALNYVVSILWIVGTINAVNCLDCADGSAGASCLTAFVAFAAMSAAHGRFFVCHAALAGAGAMIGFLLFNAPPARVFLGDTGSTFLGLMVAALAILSAPANVSVYEWRWEPLVLFIPVIDIGWVHFRRYRAGIRSVRDLLSSAGKDHLPHRLMAHGLTKPACALAMGLLTGLAAVAAHCLSHGLWPAGLVAGASLLLFLVHLETGSTVTLRKEDGVALYYPRRAWAASMAVSAEEGT